MSSHHGVFSSLSQPSRMLLHTTRPGLRSKKEPRKKPVSSLASGCAAIVPGQRSQDNCPTGQARAIIAWPCSREYCSTAEKQRMEANCVVERSLATIYQHRHVEWHHPVRCSNDGQCERLPLLCSPCDAYSPRRLVNALTVSRCSGT